MIKIYVAAYKEFSDYKTLKKVYDFFLSKQEKNNVLFYVSTGESGDNTCMKYVRENEYNYIDWLPRKKGKNRAEEKLQFIKDSDYAILFTDGHSVGINIAIRYACKYLKKFVIVRMQCKDLQVWRNGELIKKMLLNNI